MNVKQEGKRLALAGWLHETNKGVPEWILS